MTKYDHNIQQLNFDDVKSVEAPVKYMDDELAFADDIRTVQSLHNVFRVNFFALVFCLEGHLTLKINGRQYSLEANDGMFVDAQSVVSDIEHDSDFRCKVIALADGVGLSFLSKSVYETVLTVKDDAVVHFSDEHLQLFAQYYHLAIFKAEHREIAFNNNSVKHLLHAFVLDLIAVVNKLQGRDDATVMRQGDKVFRQFILMLGHNGENLRSVSEFADRLCVSPKYLSSVCVQHTSKTARELIAQSVVSEIKRQLLYSDLSVKEIAALMGFDNLSFFGKYVKKHLGASPNTFRRLNNYGR